MNWRIVMDGAGSSLDLLFEGQLSEIKKTWVGVVSSVVGI
jgi:hypothetical protein